MNLFQDIFTYAFRGSGKYLLIVGVILTIVTDIAGVAPLIGGLAVLLLTGYFCAIYFQLIESSAGGDEEAPMFSDISNLFEDMIWPMLQVWGVAIVSFAPYIAYLVWLGDIDMDDLISYALLVFGIVYFPMAMLAVVVRGTVWSISPHIVVPSIFRAGWLYLMAVALLVALYFLQLFIAESMEIHFLVDILVLAVIGMYVLMTNARILGLICHKREEELGWF